MAELIPLEKRIPKADREELAEWFESHTYTTFRKWLLEDGRTQLAIQALLGTKDSLDKTQGRADALKQIHGQLKAIHGEVAKSKEKSQEKKADKRSD